MYDKFYFTFSKGILQKLKIINPFFRYFFDENRDSLKAIDTLTFSFQNGKLDDFNFYNHNSFYKIQPAFKSDCANDTAGLKKLSVNEKFYVHDYSGKDSSLIMLYKTYNFNDWQQTLSLQYDSLKTLTRLVLLSGYPLISHPNNINDDFPDSTLVSMYLLSMEFDKNKCLRNMSCAHDVDITMIDNGAGGLKEVLTFSDMDIDFLPCGILNLK